MQSLSLRCRLRRQLVLGLQDIFDESGTDFSLRTDKYATDVQQ